jgi:hypothetical protein
MKTLARVAALLAAVSVLGVNGTDPSELFICVEWPDHPHGHDLPIYYWNPAHEAYIWHGADCSLFPNGEALNCDSSRIMGTDGNDAAAYNGNQGIGDLANRQRLAFFKSCRMTINTLEKDDAGAWVFRQNGATQASGGTCTETNVEDCNGKFASPIKVTAGAQTCLKSYRNYRGYFASIEEKLLGGVNPVLAMPAQFKAMIDGGIQCNAADKLPIIATDEDGIYGVMSWDNSRAIQLIQQVMPKPECLVTFPANESDNLVVGSDTNRTCMEEYPNETRTRRLSEGGAAGGKSALVTLGSAPSKQGNSGASGAGLASWVLVLLAVVGVRSLGIHSMI